MANMIPDFSSGAWRTYTTPDGKHAEYSVSPDGTVATIRARECYGVGKWLVTVDVEGGAVYDFAAKCRTEVAECDAYLIVTQYDERGAVPLREHIKDTVREGEFLLFSDKLQMMPTAVKLEVELWIKGFGSYGEWHVPTLTPGEPEPSRKVRVAPVHFKWTKEFINEEKQFEAYMTAFDTLGERGVDLVVFGECMFGRGLNLSHATKVATTEPRIMKAISEKAKQYNTYAIYDGVEQEGDNYFNTAFLFDREGEICGKYRKTHITVGEYEKGVTPGCELPVFETDFGKVGILICYDQFFPDTALTLAKRGAEIICIPTAGDDHHACMALAIYTGVYLAVAGMNNENNYGWGATRVVDPLGQLIAHTDTSGEAAYCEIDLSKRVRRRWMSTGPGLSSVHDDYRYEVNPLCYRD